MAKELALRIVFTATKNNAVTSRNISASFNISATPLVQAVVNIPTTDTTLNLGGVGTNGFLYLHNLDLTNYMTFGGDGSNYFNKLKAGEFAFVRWNGAAIHAKANTGACDLEYVLFSD